MKRSYKRPRRRPNKASYGRKNAHLCITCTEEPRQGCQQFAVCQDEVEDLGLMEGDEAILILATGAKKARRVNVVIMAAENDSELVAVPVYALPTTLH